MAIARNAAEFPAWALVAEARRRAGLTQAQLAQAAGTSQAAVARYEGGETLPSLSTLQRVVRACGLELRVRLEPYDPHDEVLMDTRLAMTPEARVRANEKANHAVAAVRDHAWRRPPRHRGSLAANGPHLGR